MNPEKQRTEIAKACGWQDVKIGQDEWTGESILVGTPKNRDPQIGSDFEEPIPYYLDDLNAMHKAEKLIMDESSVTYLEWLTRLSCPWHATAAERAEAFLRTLGKWEDN